MTLMKEAKATFKQGGFRALKQKYGWKMFAAIFGYYLVRDVTLYVLIPIYGFKTLL